MGYQYDLKKYCLFFDNTLLPLTDHDIDEIGTCFKCSGLLKSLSAHVNINISEKNQNEKCLVSTCTKCSAVYVNIYDSEWSWLGDTEPELFESEMKLNTIIEQEIFTIPVYNEIINTLEDLEKIPIEQLKIIFSEAEIQAIFQKARGQKNIRQYYHRAKKKYGKYEEIFGIKMNI